MKTTITSFSTRFIGLLPPLVILLVTAIGNPDLFKKKQKSINQKPLYTSNIQVKSKTIK